MSVLTRLATTAGCLAVVSSTFVAVEARADGRRTIQTDTGVIVADYRLGNIPPADAIAVRPGQAWQGWIELDSGGEMKFYISNPRVNADDRAWRQYWARGIDCGEPSDEDAFVTVEVNDDGLAVIRCDAS